MFKYVEAAFSKATQFHGRANRSEYWWFWLFQLVISFLVAVLDSTAEVPIWSIIVTAIFFIPNLALTIRRLHDTEHSGWTYLWMLFPIAGPLYILYLLCKKGHDRPNTYGIVSRL